MRFIIRPGRRSASTTAAEQPIPPVKQAQSRPTPPTREYPQLARWVLWGVHGVLLTLLLIFSHHYWLAEDRGRHKVGELRLAVQAQQDTNARLEQRNAALDQTIDRLKLGSAALEEHARYDLGMIRRGETFVRLLEPETR